MGLPNVTAGFIKVSERKTSSRTEATALCTLITAGTPHHLCHILSVRSKSQLLPTLREGITPECEQQEVGSLGAIIQSACHRRKGRCLLGFLLINDAIRQERDLKNKRIRSEVQIG